MEKRLYAIDVPETGVTYIGTAENKGGIGFNERATLSDVVVVNTISLATKKYESYSEAARNTWELSAKARMKESLIEAEINKIINCIGSLSLKE